MKKLSFIVTAVAVSLLFIAASASAQLYLIQEGKQLMELSQYVIDQGQIMQKCACTDKAAMIAKGNELVQKGNDVLAGVMMMKTEEGRSGNGILGKKLQAAGNLLIEKGNQEGPLTDKDKEKVNTFGKDMASLGNLKLNTARVMGG